MAVCLVSCWVFSSAEPSTLSNDQAPHDNINAKRSRAAPPPPSFTQAPVLFEPRFGTSLFFQPITSTCARPVRLNQGRIYAGHCISLWTPLYVVDIRSRRLCRRCRVLLDVYTELTRQNPSTSRKSQLCNVADTMRSAKKI